MSLLAWLLFAISILILIGEAVQVAQPHPRPLGIESGGNSPFAGIGMLAFGLVGALIISRHPTHPVGWIFVVTGILVALAAFTTAYAQFAHMVPGSLPASDLVDAISGIMYFSGFLAPLTFGLLLFPDGRLLSARWRPVVWTAALAFALLFFGNLINNDTATGIAGLALLAVVLLSVASLVLRWRRAEGDERQQLKWVSSAGVVALIALLADVYISVTQLVSGQSPLPFLIFTLAFTLIPVCAGIAILRYRLYEIDILINRTLVYVPLTAILAGLFSASITLTQKLFIAETGATSDAATVITTLVIVAAFEPLKTGLQHLVDRRFKEGAENREKLTRFSDRVRSVLDVIDTPILVQELLDRAASGLKAEGGAIFWGNYSGGEPRYTVGHWTGQPKLTTTLTSDGQVFGEIALGPRRSGGEYSDADAQALARAAEQVSRALALAEMLNHDARQPEQDEKANGRFEHR